MLIKIRWLTIFLLLISISSCDSYQKIDDFKYNQVIVLTGVVTSIPETRENNLEFIFHSYKYGNIILKADKSYKHYLIPGSKLRLDAKVYKLHEYDNEAAFNYTEYLARKNIVAIGSVISGTKISFKGLSSVYLPERMRFYLYKHLQVQLEDTRFSPFVFALLLGYKTFDKSQQDLLLNSGTSHLMVISGLHIGLMALVAYLIFRGIWSFFPSLCRRIPAQYIGVTFSLFIACFYSFLAGFSLPTQRAIIMLFVVYMMWFFKKRIQMVRALLIALSIIVLLDFKSIYSISLWLSFSAVTGLVAIAIILQQYKSKLVVTLLAQIYLAILLIPISVYYFGSFSIISIFANIVAIPLVSFVIVPLLLLSLLVSFMGVKLWVVPMFFIKLLYAYLMFLTSYFGLVNYWSNFTFITLLIVIVGIFLLVFPLSKSFRLLGLAMCLVFFQSSTNIVHKYKYFQIHIFDTKKLMFLVQEQDKSLLYLSVDNLKNKYVLFDTLEKYLKVMGVEQIDYLIVVGNEPVSNLELIRKIATIKSVVSNLKLMEKTRSCNYHNNFHLTDGVLVKFLSTEKDCFVALKYGGREFLLMDDADKVAQQEIYQLYNRVVKPDIIISPVLLDQQFLKFQPTYFIYSSDQLFKRSSLQKTEVKVFDTYNNGAITIVLNKKNSLRVFSQFKKY